MHVKQAFPNWWYSFSLRAGSCLERKRAVYSRRTRKWPDSFLALRRSGAWLEGEPVCGLILFILITSLLLTLQETSTRLFWQQSGHCATEIANWSVSRQLEVLTRFCSAVCSIYVVCLLIPMPQISIYIRQMLNTSTLKWSVLYFYRRL